MAPRLVLASGSRYRRRLLEDAGYEVTVMPPGVDESDLQSRLGELGAEAIALGLAHRKARSVRPGRGAVVLAADQVGVLDTPGGPRPLTKPPTEEAAVRQLLAMAGTTHRLVNGIVVLGEDGSAAEAVDVQVVEMAAFEEAAARDYVARFRPLDTAGGYRLEDDAGLVTGVRGSGPDGVMGLPLGVVAELLAGRGIHPERSPGGSGRGR